MWIIEVSYCHQQLEINKFQNKMKVLESFQSLPSQMIEKYVIWKEKLINWRLSFRIRIKLLKNGKLRMIRRGKSLLPFKSKLVLFKRLSLSWTTRRNKIKWRRAGIFKTLNLIYRDRKETSRAKLEHLRIICISNKRSFRGLKETIKTPEIV